MALSPLATIQNILTADTELNANFTKISAAFDDIVDRQVATTMEADMDFNQHRILNLPYAVANTEPVTLAQYHELLTDGESTPVTLAGVHDYLTISGQEITLEKVDLSTDVSGTLSTEAFNENVDASAYTFLRGDGTWQKIPQQIIYPIRTTDAATDTLNTGDQNAVVVYTNATGCDVTIADNALMPGQNCRLVQQGGSPGTVTVLNSEGVTINSPEAGLATAGQHAEMELLCLSTNTYNLSKGVATTAPPQSAGEVNIYYALAAGIDITPPLQFQVFVERTGGSYGAIDVRVECDTPALCDPDYIDLSWEDGEGGLKTQALFTATGGPDTGLMEISEAPGSPASPTIGTLSDIELRVADPLPSGTYTWETAYSGCPFVVDKPTISSDSIAVRTEHTAANSTQLADALVSNTKITISGPVGNLTMTGLSNVEIILTPYALVGNVTIDGDCQYIYIHGQNDRDGEVGYIRIGDTSGSAQDITIEGITQKDNTIDGEGTDSRSNRFYVERMSVLNSYLEAYSFVVLGFARPAAPCDDIVFGNCQLVDLNKFADPVYTGPTSWKGDNQALWRAVGWNRVILRHCNIINMHNPDGDETWPNSKYQTIRFHANENPEDTHYDTTDIWVKENQIETSTSGHAFYRQGEKQAAHDAGHVVDLWWENNEEYCTLGSFSGILYDTGGSSEGQDTWPINFRLTNNNNYHAEGQWDQDPNFPSGPPPDEPHATNGYQWTISGNTASAYTTPPAWDWDSWDV